MMPFMLGRNNTGRDDSTGGDDSIGGTDSNGGNTSSRIPPLVITQKLKRRIIFGSLGILIVIVIAAIAGYFRRMS